MYGKLSVSLPKEFLYWIKRIWKRYQNRINQSFNKSMVKTMIGFMKTIVNKYSNALKESLLRVSTMTKPTHQRWTNTCWIY
jgi:hypothetical protein